MEIQKNWNTQIKNKKFRVLTISKIKGYYEVKRSTEQNSESNYIASVDFWQRSQ